MGKFYVYAFVWLISIYSCSKHTESDSPVVFLVDNYDTQPISDASEYFDLRTIDLSDSVYRAIGGELGDVFVDDSLQIVIFVDYELGFVSALSYAGELRWQLKPDGVSPHTYRQVSLADYDAASHQLQLYDNASRKIYYYSGNGVFHHETANHVDFLDVAYTQDSALIYYTDGFANYHVTNDSVGYRLIIEHADGRLSKVQASEERTSGFFDDKNEFNTYGQRIFLQRQFTDTIFEVIGDEMELFSLIKFVRGNRTQAILDDVGREDPYGDIWVEEAPYFIQAIPANDLCYGLYRTGLYNHLFITDATPEAAVNSTLLQIHEVLVPTPQRYWDGYYSGMVSEAEYNFLQDEYKRGKNLDESVFAKLIELQNQVADSGGAVLYLLKIRDIPK